MATEIDSIVHRVRNGDTDAFAEIVAAYQGAVWKVVSYAMGDRLTSEDLAQQTFVNAFQRLDQFETGREMGAWLCGIARNLVRQELRRKSRHDRRFQPFAEYLDTVSEAQGAECEKELADALRQCREGMKGAARTALDLRCEQEKGFEEMATMLGRTVPAVRQLLQRARQALRECIEKKLAAA